MRRRWHGVRAFCCAGLALIGALLATGALAQAPAPTATQPTQPQQTAPQAPAAQPAPPTAEPVPPPARPEPTVEELVKPVDALAAAIDAAEKSLEQSPGTHSNLATLRTNIDRIERQARDAGEQLRAPLDAVRAQIDKLGTAPGPNEPAEPADVAAERQRLSGIAAQIDGAIKKSSLIAERARQLVSRVQHLRQGIFTRFLFSQSDTPLQWRVWQQAGDQLYLARRQIGFILTNWWAAAALNLSGLLGVLGAALLVYAALRFVTRRFISSRLDAAGPSIPSAPERAATAAWVAPALALPSAVALIILYVGLDELGLLYWQVEQFAQALLFPLFVVIGISALSTALLQPKRPRWRLLKLDDAGAATVSRAMKAIVVVYALDAIVRRLVNILSLPISTSVASAFIASLLYALLLLVIARTPAKPPASAPGVRVSRWQPYWLKGLLIVLALLLVGTATLGYVTLGRFITTQLLTTGAGLLLVGVLHLAIQAIVPNTAERQEGMSAIIGERLQLDTFGRSQVARVLRGVLNILLFVLAVPLLLIAWGKTPAEISSWFRAAIFGFEIGGVHISLARILVALALFALILAVTRFVQRWLAAGALAQGRIEPGLANSIYTGAGYIGFAVATLAAIAYAGFDITSLAIVAGALSVGIGFGLQSIVNNFVSGLILLVERPIKVGDRVTVNGQEGFVRRISVRSTEIETFDRANLIVPNSEFITSTVTNWTHRNALGRALVRVVVTHDADPERVIAILLEVAGECPLLLRHPPAWAGLENIGMDGLEFTLIATVPDINKVGDARSDLRVRILKALHAANIDVAAPTRELRLRDAEALRTLVKTLLDEQAGSSASEAADDVARHVTTYRGSDAE